MSTKAQARQRAHYKYFLEQWKAGKWTPPAGWAQMVANRFPKLIEEYRDAVLGKAEAELARDKHRVQVAPKVGQFMEVPSMRRVIVTSTDPLTAKFGVAHATRWNVFVVKALLLFKRIFRRS